MLKKSEENKYFYHYVNHIKHYPIRNTIIDAIKIEFFDISGKKFILKPGQPSFVHFHLKTMNPKEVNNTFYVRVDSGNNALKIMDTITQIIISKYH